MLINQTEISVSKFHVACLVAENIVKLFFGWNDILTCVSESVNMSRC